MVHAIVGLVTKLLVGRSRARIPTMENVFSSQNICTGSEAHHSRPINGYQRFISRVNRPGREFGRSPPSSAEDKMSGAIPLLPLHALVTCTGRISLKNKNQVDATYYFIVLLIGSTCFGHYYVHHQEFTTIMLITTLVFRSWFAVG